MRQPAIFACYVIATLALAVLVLVGFALAWLYVKRPAEEEAWNCWAFAIPKWLGPGGDPVRTALLITCSRGHKAIPHVGYVPNVDGVHYEEAVPIERRKGWRAVFDSVKFKPKIRRR